MLMSNYGVKQLGPSDQKQLFQYRLLKDLMTTPPMTAKQHADIMRKHIEHRRMLEEAKELKTASEDVFEQL